jgi:hypothetical protein
VFNLILGFTFFVWFLYFDFHKVNVIYIFNNKFKRFNLKNNGYIYGIYNMIYPIYYFRLHYFLFEFLKQKPFEMRKN